MRWYDKFCVIDVETTGLGVDDEIVQIALVGYEDGRLIDLRLVTVNPGIPIPEEASKIHGITDERVKDKSKLVDIAPKIIENLKQYEVLVMYNAPFDLGFMVRCCPGFGDMTHRVIDPIVVARQFDEVREPGRFKLENLYARMGLPPVEGRVHNALTDAKMAGNIAWAQQGLLPEDPYEASHTVWMWRAMQEAKWKRTR